MLQRLFYARLFLVTTALAATIYTKEGNIRTSCSHKTYSTFVFCMQDLLIRATNVDWITRLEGSAEFLPMIALILEQYPVLKRFEVNGNHCVINGLFYNGCCQQELYRRLLLACRGTDWVITTKAGRRGCSYHWTNWSV